MTMHVHLVGGAGRIGTALAKSLLSDPLENLGSLSVYCDLTKAKGLYGALEYKGNIPIQVESYSAFALKSVIDKGWAHFRDRHVVMLLRGVNDKRYWLNQPLEAMNIQLRACHSLIESDVSLHQDVRIIHFTSQLCDLIESVSSLAEICGGLDSYRRPYMISRLHQEATLTAFAYQRSIPTTFIRLASVYGFYDDENSPWVLNSLITQHLKHHALDIRNPDTMLYLMHRDPLIRFLRSQLGCVNLESAENTVSYVRPPMLPVPVKTLGAAIEAHGALDSSLNHFFENTQLTGNCDDAEMQVSDHVRLLTSVIGELIHNRSS